ncbi:MAG: transmembrane domain-containing protein [Cyanobacteria bacterium P01_A01_bin.17]
MKIIQKTSDTLVLQEKLLGIWILGLGTAATGFFIVMSFESPVDLFGGVCIAIAALVSTLSPTETCIFDKTTRLITLRRQRWFSHRIQQQNIAQIADVMVEPYTVMGTQFFRVSLVLSSGQTIALTRSASTDRAAQQHLAQHIQHFLSLNQNSLSAAVATR